MTKITAAQARILEALRAGARIQHTGYGNDGRMTLMVPDANCYGGFDWIETVRESTFTALSAAKLIRRVGDAYSRDAYWIAE